MLKLLHLKALLSSLFLFGVCCIPSSTAFSASLDAPAASDFTADIEAEATQPVNAPLLTEVKFTNTSQKVIYYWCGGPGSYPNAGWFTAKVTDDKGKETLYPMENGQYTQGSGISLEINLTSTVTIPALLPPLPVGIYSIQIRGGKKAVVSVKDDANVTHLREQDTLDKIRKGDPFARFSFTRYGNRFVRDTLLRDLIDDNADTVDTAAYTLYFNRSLSEDATPFVNQAMQKQLVAQNKGGRHSTILNYLADIAANIGSDNAMEIVLTLIHSQEDSRTRSLAVNSLRRFKQEKATKEFHALTQDEDSMVRSAAVYWLAVKRNPSVIELVIQQAQSANAADRVVALRLMTDSYASDPRTEPLVRKAITDPDSQVRSQAENSLKDLERRHKN